MPGALLCPLQAAVLVMAAPDDNPESRVNILLVDDQPANLLALESILAGLGQNLVRASSGEEALRRLLQDHFAVVLLDVQMHGLDGFETAQLIRGRKKSRHTPIIFLTAYESTDFSVRRAYSLGAVDYLIKPLVPEILEAKVRSFVELFQKTRQVIRQSERLRAGEERMRLILDTAQNAFVAMDAQGRITEWNCQSEATFGWTRADVLQRPLAETIIPARHREAHYHGLQHFLDTGEGPLFNRRIETTALHKDGHEFPVELIVSPPLHWEGTYLFSAFLHDISERKQAEEDLKRTAAELARSNRDLQQFASVASHDLREPLRKVRLLLQLLEERCRDQLDDQAHQYLAAVVDSAARLDRLVSDLLAYARVDSRGKPLVPTESALAFDQAVANLETAIHEIGAVVIARTNLPAVRGDLTQLIQLFQNLIANAIKFHGDKDPFVQVEVQPRGKEWLFAVRDNGIGIDPRHAERIFVLFERLHSQRQYPGTGIGLAICKKIVERHGGSIGVESKPGESATFWFTLPAVERQAP
jgi:PAS domain S-box-containing protein